MQANFRIRKIRAIALFLCLAALCGALLAVGANAVGTVAESTDFGLPGAGNNRLLSGAALYRALFGTEPTAAEAEYLARGSYTLTYHDAIPDRLVNTEYNSEAGTLTVTAAPYIYTAANGKTVMWVPETASAGGKTVSLQADGTQYRGIFSDLFRSEDLRLELSYRLTLEIPASFADALRNDAFAAGKAAWERWSAYLEEADAYQKKMDAYEAYRDYLQWVRDYEVYCERIAVYREQKAAYDAYMVLYRAYLEEYAIYEQWQAYYAYEDFRLNHLEEYNAYVVYQKKMEAFRARLNILESVYTRDSHGWQLYASVMGSLVTQVLERRNELLISGCSPADLDLAAKATEKLRVLLKAYDDVRKATYASEHQSIAARFSFYTGHYEELKTAFTDLYRALYALYDNTILVEEMKKQGKVEHYQQFVGQLYVVATCLDDAGNRKSNWNISKKPLSAVVEAAQLLPDTNEASPYGLTLPGEVAKVEAVPKAEKPTSPQPAEEPEAPDVVPEPMEEPVKVEKPREEDRPPEAEKPEGDAPQAPVLDDTAVKLMEEVSAGTLSGKAAVTEPVALTLSAVAVCKVSIRNLKTVTFYGADGNVLQETMLNYGESVSAPPVPERAETAQYSYRALGWVTSDGQEADLMEVRTNLSLYPLYDITVKTYRIVWRVDGTDYAQTYPYGSLPTPPFALTKPEETHYIYRFSGWDKDVLPVTEDVVYTGSFEKVPKRYTVTWILENGKRRVTEEVPYGTVPSFAGDTTAPTDSYLYSFTGWDRVLRPVDGDTEYTAVYRRTPLIPADTGGAVPVEVTDTEMLVYSGQSSLFVERALLLSAESGRTLVLQWGAEELLKITSENAERLLTAGCRQISLFRGTVGSDAFYRLSLSDTDGEAVLAEQFSATLTLPSGDNVKKKLAYRQNGKELIPLSAGELAAVSEGMEIVLRNAYRLTVVPNALCNTAALGKYVSVGDTVSLRLSCQFGYEVTGAAVRTADGKTVPLDDLSFVMPEQAAEISLTVTQIFYRVSFLVNGNLWHQETVPLGEEIPLPEDPSLPEENGIRYRFSGWDPIPAFASGKDREMTFCAVFTEIPPEAEYTTGNNNNRFLQIFLPIACGVLLSVAGIFLLRKKKKARQKGISETLAGAEETGAMTALTPEEPPESAAIPKAPEGTAEAETGDGSNPLEQSDSDTAEPSDGD